MRITTKTICLCIIVATSLLSCKNKSVDLKKDDSKVHNELYNTVMQLDSIFFKSYNTCDLETQKQMISEDLEFYHDQGGLTTSKEELILALKNNICGKVTRTLIEGSVEVYPIPDFGAVQIGLHKFYNNQEPDAISKPSKFVTLWKQENDTWLMTRVVSLH